MSLLRFQVLRRAFLFLVAGELQQRLHLSVGHAFGFARFENVHRVLILSLLQHFARPRQVLAAAIFGALLLQALGDHLFQRQQLLVFRKTLTRRPHQVHGFAGAKIATPLERLLHQPPVFVFLQAPVGLGA